MSSNPSPSPSEPSSKDQSARQSQTGSENILPESVPISRPRYKNRNGRSWYRKSDLPAPQSPDSDFLIGIQAIAKFIGFSYATASKLIHIHGMPACAFGDNRYRIHPESLFRWLEAYSESMSNTHKKMKENANN